MHSEIPLSATEHAVDVADITIRLHPDTADHLLALEGEPIAELTIDGRCYYRASRDEHERITLRVEGLADFVVQPNLAEILCVRTPSCPADFLPILITGTLTAFLLTLRGSCVLHASSVAVGGEAVAFAAVSGGGKTTLAAQLCVVGARLVTDDVLPLETGAGGVHIVGHAREMRLRQGAASLVDSFSSELSVRPTADDRLAIAVPATLVERCRLVAIVLPRPSRTATHTSFQRLSSVRSTFELACQARIVLRDEVMLARQFDQIATVSSTVPVFIAEIPWGPPFLPSVAREILDHVGLG